MVRLNGNCLFYRPIQLKYVLQIRKLYIDCMKIIRMEKKKRCETIKRYAKTAKRRIINCSFFINWLLHLPNSAVSLAPLHFDFRFFLFAAMKLKRRKKYLLIGICLVRNFLRFLFFFFASTFLMRYISN